MCRLFYRAMFTGEMKEREQEVISLNGISAIGMQELLDYAYTSTLALTSGKINSSGIIVSRINPFLMNKDLLNGLFVQEMRNSWPYFINTNLNFTFNFNSSIYILCHLPPRHPTRSVSTLSVPSNL